MIKKLFVLLWLVAFSHTALAYNGTNGEYFSKTAWSSYNPFYENTVVENSGSLVMLFLIMVVLILILYKGEITIENIKKMNERRLRIKKEKKKIKKLLKSK